MKYKLNEANIDAVCKEADAFLIQKNTEPRDRTHTRLSIEEVLLTYMGILGKDAEFIVEYGGGLTKSRIRLTVPGNPADPFSLTESASEDDRLLADLLTKMGQRPKWRYVRGANTIIYTPAKKRFPEWARLMIAILAAVILGLIVRVLPERISTILQQDIIAPLLNTFLGFLNAVAGPMIFLSVIWGIYSIGDASSFSDVGRRLCVRFLLYLCIMTLVITLIFLPLFSLQYGETQNGNQYSELYQMVLNIIPDNLFAPFVHSNTLQIMFVGIVVGVMMLTIGKNTQTVADLAEQLGYIVDGIMGVISRLVPVFVFGSLFNIIASSNLTSFAAGGKFFALTLAGCLLLILFHSAAACVKMGIGPLDLWKRTFSTFIIAISTASSSAAFADNKKTCLEDLGVSRRLVNFGVPFGQILYKPSVSLLFWFAAVSVAESSGVKVSAVWYITAALVCIILSVAAPPVPGGMTASFTILFAQLALPVSVSDLAVILSLTSILDFALTATDVFSGQCVLAVTSRSIEKRKRQR